MPDTPRQTVVAPEPRVPRDPDDPRERLARAIPRRPAVSWWLGIVLALGFAALVTPAITAERWLGLRGAVTAREAAPFTVRAPMLAGYDHLQVRGGVVVARGEVASRDEAALVDAIAEAMPRGPVLYLAFFALSVVLATLFTHHIRRSTKGRLVRVQVVSLVGLVVLAVAVKLMLLATALSALVVPIAVLAMVPTMALDRVVGLATGVLGAVIVSLLAPFDVGLAILLLVQAATAGLVIAEHPRRRWVAALTAGVVTTLCTAATYLLLTYLTTGHPPDLRDPLHAAWFAAAIGPALAAVIAVPLLPLYQLLVGEITQGRLYALQDLGHPLLRQIAERSPGTWQHSLMMANMAEIAANAIGASGRLVRVGAYFHDLGKSMAPKYFIENLEPGETSPHDTLPPEVSCDAIFAHVTGGIAAARKARLHERIVDFMHMHHGNGVLEYFWAKCREQGNPHQLTIDRFRYPGHPPQSRETAMLAICDAVEAASRTLNKPDTAAIDSLVQRIVYGKLHLGQLDESGLSMSDLRRISASLRETIRHANHGRIEYPWQKASQDASASAMSYSTTPRLDSLDRKPGRDSQDALAATADAAPAEPQIRAGTARKTQHTHPAPPDTSRETARNAVLPPIEREPRAIPEVVTIAPRRDARRREPSDPRRKPVAAVTPETLGSEPSPAASKRAATSPPVQTYRPPTTPPPVEGPPASALRTAAPTDELDNAITNPPPLARGPGGPPASTDPAQIATALASLVARVRSAPFGAAAPEAAATTPDLPALREPPAIDERPFTDEAVTARRTAAGSTVPATVPSGPRDDWGLETPIFAPDSAELRALLDAPDPTREQSLDEIEQLQRRAAELADPDPRRRVQNPTAEVDPDDIEAAIELAPPARRLAAKNAIAASRPKKSE